MDELKIESKFMAGLVSRLMKKMLAEKCGCPIDIHLNGLRSTMLDEKLHVHLDVDLELTKDELAALAQKCI